ncbi:hypothetical protein LMTR13_08980 [Bradyrhizobium icense]|uniref:Beta-ketoacyl synthase C-terminal domain-containing protein n=1 Tax=Bradyrhizobium icense TaxID=1274631 RepID=A0A1B1UC11_9BRAD|nr:hypothetical protein LMTR13_08980 [Bradyrhizobium icense]
MQYGLRPCGELLQQARGTNKILRFKALSESLIDRSEQSDGLGPAASRDPVCGKSATGHLLGAAGGAEAIFTILALRDQVAPPTLNLENGDAAADGVDLAAREARPMTMEHAISNGFGFGGVNASVIFRRWQ